MKRSFYGKFFEYKGLIEEKKRENHVYIHFFLFYIK